MLQSSDCLCLMFGLTCIIPTGEGTLNINYLNIGRLCDLNMHANHFGWKADFNILVSGLQHARLPCKVESGLLHDGERTSTCTPAVLDGKRTLT